MKMKNMARNTSTILKRMRRSLPTPMKSTPNCAKNTLSCGKNVKRWPLRSADGNGLKKRKCLRIWLNWSKSCPPKKKRKNVSVWSISLLAPPLLLTKRRPSTLLLSKPEMTCWLITLISLMSKRDLKSWSWKELKVNSIWVSMSRFWPGLPIWWSRIRMTFKRLSWRSTFWSYCAVLWSRLRRLLACYPVRIGSKPINVSTNFCSWSRDPLLSSRLRKLTLKLRHHKALRKILTPCWSKVISTIPSVKCSQVCPTLLKVFKTSYGALTNPFPTLPWTISKESLTRISFSSCATRCWLTLVTSTNRSTKPVLRLSSSTTSTTRMIAFMPLSSNVLAGLLKESISWRTQQRQWMI